MGQVIKTPQAELDLVEIWLYVAEDSEQAASELLRRIDRVAAELAEMPGRGTPREELIPGIDLRSVPVGNYLIFYRPIEPGIEILRVLHGARDLDALL